MNRRYKIAIVTFCLGVLLCGIGTGIAFTEFSALAYGGMQILGDPTMVTENFDVEFEPQEDAWSIIGASGFYHRGNMNIQPDSSVPVNTVRFCVTYNTKRVAPFTNLNIDNKRIEFSWYWKNVDEMALVMEAKDIVLQNLKKGMIVSCETVELEEVAVLVNPKSVDDVKIIH